MLERIMSGLMALWMALSPARSDAGQVEAEPESTAVVIQAEAEQQQDTAEQSPALTLDDIRAVTFSDSPADAADAISYAAYFQLMSGYEDGAFRPDGFLTASQAVRILRRIAAKTGLDSGPESSDDLQWASAVELLSVDGDNIRLTFRPPLTEYQDGVQLVIDTKDGAQVLVDTKDGAQTLVEYHDEWAALYGKGVTFSPEARITRARFALLLYRFAMFAGYDLGCTGNLSLRPDADSVPDYARIPYSWAMERDIYRTIVTDGLCPGIPVSRAQAALVFTALLAAGTGENVAVEITQAAQKPFFISKSRDLHGVIQEAVDNAGRRYGATGLQVAVIEHGQLTDTFAYGWAAKNSERMTPTYKMRIASISKVLIGLTAARMREDGLVNYSEPFGTYWDSSFVNPAHPNTPVTLKTLLTHTASLADGSLVASAVRQRLGAGRGFTSAVPGSLDNWEYSNYGFGVLGLTLERVAGRTMDQLLDRYFFDLMDSDGSFYAGDLNDASHIVTLYRDGAVTLSASSQRNRHNPGVCKDGSVFAGGLVISVRDLGKIAALLANDGVYEGLRLLDADSVRLIETYENQKVSDGFYQAMPVRYRTDAYGRTGIYYHTGSAYGVFNGFSYDPQTGDGVVVLTVGASGARDSNGNYAICGAIFDAVYHTIES